MRGNADRALLEGAAESERERWMQESHTTEMLEFVRGFEENVVVEIDGLGAVRFCHGSPRSDEECVTPETPEDRVREFSAECRSASSCRRTHIQFDREVGGIRSVNPGERGPSVRRPVGCLLGAARPGRGALPDRLRRPARRCRLPRERFPGAEQLAEMLLAPPEPAEVIEDAERRVFAG